MKALRILGYILGCIWSLPLLVVSLLLMAYYRPQKFRWYAGCLEYIADVRRNPDGSMRFDDKGRPLSRILGSPGGQCLGCPVIAYRSELDWNYTKTRIHERVHLIQGFVLGILFGPLYGGHWLLIRCFDTPDEPRGEPAWKRAYRAIWAEKMAVDYARNHPDGWGA